MRTILAVATLLLLPGIAQADCCAGGRAHYLAYGSQFGYGGGLGHGRTAQPFAGVQNPRYAHTQSIGGPLGVGPLHPVASQPLVGSWHLAALDQEASGNATAYASDARLMDQPPPADPPASDEADEPVAPQYPGQQYSQAAYQAPPATASRSTPAPRSRRREAPEQAAVVTRRASGVFANETATRVARNLRASGIDF